jgi:hypothetical protein
MDAVRPGLARDVIRLLIAVVRLITAILTFLSGAANYGGPCSARTSTNSSCRMDIRFLSHRGRLAKPAKRFTRMCNVDGDRLAISSIYGWAVTSAP